MIYPHRVFNPNQSTSLRTKKHEGSVLIFDGAWGINKFFALG